MRLSLSSPVGCTADPARRRYALFIRIARRVYAATVYSTLVHTEMSLADIDRCAEPGPFSAMHLLRYRLMSGNVRKAHRPYDKRPWTLVLLYFLFICLLANIGNFLYGRTVIISALNVPQVRLVSRCFSKLSLVDFLNDSSHRTAPGTRSRSSAS